jgi:hypothetical protein
MMRCSTSSICVQADAPSFPLAHVQMSFTGNNFDPFFLSDMTSSADYREQKGGYYDYLGIVGYINSMNYDWNHLTYTFPRCGTSPSIVNWLLLIWIITHWLYAL